MKIAVIGAGIFGTEISLKLSREGHDVHLYEKEYEILKGATAGSQNRLHMGLHYPRDLKTAIQSRVG
jgi:glycerol-3-phosphate dehydrogenase